MSIAQDEHMSVTDDLSGFVLILVSSRVRFVGRNRIVRRPSRPTDIVTRLVAILRRLYFKAYTVNNRSLLISKSVVEYQLTVDIVHAREPEIGFRFERQCTYMERYRHVHHIVAQVNAQAVPAFRCIDIERRSRRGG